MAKPNTVDPLPTPEAEEMPDEQAAALRLLEAGANEPNAQLRQLEQAEEDQAAQVELSLTEKNAQALGMVCELAVPVLSTFGFPKMAGVIGAQSETQPGMNNGQVIAAAWAPVLTKYGVDLGEFGGKYKAEIAAVFATIPIGQALYMALKEDTGQVPKALASTAPAAPEKTEPERLG